jgi:hypothetical protein
MLNFTLRLTLGRIKGDWEPNKVHHHQRRPIPGMYNVIRNGGCKIHLLLYIKVLAPHPTDENSNII